jgi:hypothetical protein
MTPPSPFTGQGRGWLAPDGAYFQLCPGETHGAWAKLYFGKGWKKCLEGAGWLRTVNELNDYLHVNRTGPGAEPSVAQLRVIKDWHKETGITVIFDLPGSMPLRSLTRR